MSEEKKRYFLISYHAKLNTGHWGYGSIGAVGSSFPNRKEISDSVKSDGKDYGNIIVLNIMEFKSKQDYNEYFK